MLSKKHKSKLELGNRLEFFDYLNSRKSLDAYEVWYNRGMKIVGHLTPKVIKAFDLDYKPGEEITLSAQRKKHMEKHRQEFSDFDATYERIPEIIAHPDYIGCHPNGQSLEYIKRIDGNVLVAVRLCDKLNVRTMFVIKDSKLKNYLNAGRAKKM